MLLWISLSDNPKCGEELSGVVQTAFLSHIITCEIYTEESKIDG
jgi:hypothetical protein